MKMISFLYISLYHYVFFNQELKYKEIMGSRNLCNGSTRCPLAEGIIAPEHGQLSGGGRVVLTESEL